MTILCCNQKVTFDSHENVISNEEQDAYTIGPIHTFNHT